MIRLPNNSSPEDTPPRGLGMASQVDEMSPTQELLYDCLKDGKYHSGEELKLIIKPDGSCTVGNFSFHLSTMRVQLRKRKQDIITINADRRVYYQLTVKADWPELFPPEQHD